MGRRQLGLLAKPAAGRIPTPPCPLAAPPARPCLCRCAQGTLFVLVKETTPRERLLEALAQGAGDSTIEALALELGEAQARGEASGAPAPARSPLAEGVWRLRWSRQGAGANPFQKALAGQVENLQLLGGGVLENRVCLPAGARVRALADCEPVSDTRTRVAITEVLLERGDLRLPLPIKPDGDGYVDWLFLDKDCRVTRGNKGSLFVHTRDSE